jgi:putative cardiolipin synthase
MIAWKRWGRACAFVPLVLLAACAQLPEHPGLPVVTALLPGEDTPLDRTLSAAEAQHPGQSGFRLVIEGTEAFVIRMHSAQLAGRSLDVQTYIWHADATGLYLARQALAAADRGVKVRLLVDDLDARARNAGFAALDAHPNIEVRLFNPFASRSGGLRLASEGARDFDRINRRMHNKSWIADNRLALVGGRNLGDEYFAASGAVNFVDLDFAMVGPVVRDVSASFDRFWNSSSAWSMELLDPEAVNAEALARVRARLEQRTRDAGNGQYAQALRDSDGVQRLVRGDWPLRWSSKYQFVSDDPAKVTMKKRDASRAAVGAAIAPMMRNAARSLLIISPYFVPGKAGSAGLIERVVAGADVQVLTNSLAANDVASVHGGYSRHRHALVEGGVTVYELKPASASAPAQAKEDEAKLTGSSGASLHTKALTADGRSLFVGSYNLDPRSTWLNTEQGVLVEDEKLAAQLGEIFALQTSGHRAWRVTLEGDSLRWGDGTETLGSEPQASFGKKFQAWLARVFHLDAQL